MLHEHKPPSPRCARPSSAGARSGWAVASEPRARAHQAPACTLPAGSQEPPRGLGTPVHTQQGPGHKASLQDSGLATLPDEEGGRPCSLASWRRLNRPTPPGWGWVRAAPSPATGRLEGGQGPVSSQGELLPGQHCPRLRVHEGTGVRPVPSQGRQVLGLGWKHGEPRKADQPKVTTWPPPTCGDTPQRAENHCSNTHLYRKVPSSTTAEKGRNNPNSHQQMNGYQNVVYAYVPRLITQPWKGVMLFLMLPRGGTVKTGCNRRAARHQRSPRV